MGQNGQIYKTLETYFSSNSQKALLKAASSRYECTATCIRRFPTVRTSNKRCERDPLPQATTEIGYSMHIQHSSRRLNLEAPVSMIITV